MGLPSPGLGYDLIQLVSLLDPVLGCTGGGGGGSGGGCCSLMRSGLLLATTLLSVIVFCGLSCSAHHQSQLLQRVLYSSRGDSTNPLQNLLPAPVLSSRDGCCNPARCGPPPPPTHAGRCCGILCGLLPSPKLSGLLVGSGRRRYLAHHRSPMWAGTFACPRHALQILLIRYPIPVPLNTYKCSGLVCGNPQK